MLNTPAPVAFEERRSWRARAWAHLRDAAKVYNETHILNTHAHTSVHVPPRTHTHTHTHTYTYLPASAGSGGSPAASHPRLGGWEPVMHTHTHHREQLPNNAGEERNCTGGYGGWGPVTRAHTQTHTHTHTHTHHRGQLPNNAGGCGGWGPWCTHTSQRTTAEQRWWRKKLHWRLWRLRACDARTHTNTHIHTHHRGQLLNNAGGCGGWGPWCTNTAQKVMCTWESYVYLRKLCVSEKVMCTWESYVYLRKLCVPEKVMCIWESYVYLRKLCVAA